MSTYKEIHGKAIKSISSDLSESTDAGQIFYNTTGNVFKSIVTSQAWISSGSLPSTRQHTEGAGTQTAGLAIGGATGPATPTYLNTSCEYNGTGWSGTDTKNAAAAIAESTFGTQTAAVAAGGYTGSSPAEVTAAEEYNGSSWTSVTAMPQGTRSAMGCGAETSGLVVGGEADPGVITNTQEYNGSSWTAGGAIPAATYNAGAGGTTESNSWFAGGYPFKNTTFLYNGSAWTASGNINTARHSLGGAGISTAALIFGGTTPPSGATTATENFDGSSWTTSPATLGTAAVNAAAFGTKTAAVYAGNDPAANITQEYNSSTNVITAAAWASGGALNQARRIQGNAGGKDAGLACGGFTSSPAYLNNSEEYDGTSWTEGNNLNTARYGLRALGLQTAAVAVGGQKSGTPTALTTCENYDGSSWTNTGSMNVAREEPAVFGIQTAGVACNGFNGAPLVETNATEEFDGSSWTASNTTNSVSYAAMSAGTQTAGVRSGGYLYPASAYQIFTEEYDGSSWTSVNNMLESKGSAAPAKNGTQSAWQLSGGRNSAGVSSNTIVYDGTNWTTGASISTARTEFDGGGTSSGSGAHLICAGTPGSTPGGVTTTEEFTAETTAANVKTISSS